MRSKKLKLFSLITLLSISFALTTYSQNDLALPKENEVHLDIQVYQFNGPVDCINPHEPWSILVSPINTLQQDPIPNALVTFALHDSYGAFISERLIHVYNSSYWLHYGGGLFQCYDPVLKDGLEYQININGIEHGHGSIQFCCELFQDSEASSRSKVKTQNLGENKCPRSIIVVNVLGQIMIQTENPDSIDFSSFGAGIFFLFEKNNQEVVLKKKFYNN